MGLFGSLSREFGKGREKADLRIKNAKAYYQRQKAHREADYEEGKKLKRLVEQKYGEKYRQAKKFNNDLMLKRVFGISNKKSKGLEL
jgi:hypothetical protein